MCAARSRDAPASPPRTPFSGAPAGSAAHRVTRRI
jgi:hypothetical protein